MALSPHIEHIESIFEKIGRADARVETLFEYYTELPADQREGFVMALVGDLVARRMRARTRAVA